MRGKTLAHIILLFFAFLCGISGILLFRSIYNDFSIFNISYQIVGTVFGSSLLLTIATWLGRSAFKNTR